MKILLLGGTGDAVSLARDLLAAEHDVIYSLAGLVRQATLACEVISGGFSGTSGRSGVDGLGDFLTTRQIDLLIDATHPYATRISANAARAAQRSGLPCWRYLRPAWPAELTRDCTRFTELADLLPLLAALSRPLFTTGRGILESASSRPDHQHWIVRTALPQQVPRGITVIAATGPFSLDAERALLQKHQIDALVTKDSGGSDVIAKLHAANERDIPVFMQQRPVLLDVDRSFAEPATLLDAANTFSRP